VKFEVLIEEYLDPEKRLALFSAVNDYEDGQWRYSKFQNYIWDNISETSLTYRERESLVDHSRLVAAAKNLRLTDSEADIGSGSELAEIFLYGLMKERFGALPVVPKIFYKQNSQDNAKGSDSVHIVLNSTGDDFTLWLGEAKFYNSIEDPRLDAVISTLATALRTDKIKKETAIITNLAELRFFIKNEILLSRILSTLSSDASIDSLKPKLHVPILLLHECEHTANSKAMTPAYRQSVIEHHRERSTSYFLRQSKKLNGIQNISEISFHLFLFPVPSKSNVIKRFLSNVEHYKREAEND
jgi:hypothetical protein